MPALSNPKHERFAQALAKGYGVHNAMSDAAMYPMEWDRSGAGPPGHYVYVLADPRNDLAFYVGKGTGKRALCHERAERAGREKNELKAEVLGNIRRAGLSPIIYIAHEDMTERDAYRLERLLIVRAHARLTNIGFGQRTELERAQAESRTQLATLKPLCTVWRERRPRWQNRAWATIVGDLKRMILARDVSEI